MTRDDPTSMLPDVDPVSVPVTCKLSTVAESNTKFAADRLPTTLASPEQSKV